MRPVKASGWKNTELTDSERGSLIAAGIVPVNDTFYPLWDKNSAITLLFGGYGSGKSDFIQTLLLNKCITEKYFKCYYGRKVLEDVRGSVHSKFITLIKRYGLEHEFKFSEENNGSMVIKHRKTGNTFIPFGSSKADSLKSIDDPTHFFLEEMDQFSLADFGVILSRLRTTKGNLQLYGAFNTSKVFPEHWIRKTFFAEESEDQTESEKELLKEIASTEVMKLFCNYTDNYFIDQRDYYNKLAMAAAGNTEVLKATAEGAWGTHKPDNPFAIQYRSEVHESKNAVFRPNIPIRIIVDFNMNPFACNICHIWRDEDGDHCHIFDEFSIQGGSIPKLCDQIRSKYRIYLPTAHVTGDAMGRRGDIAQRDNASNYLLIQRALSLRPNQMNLPPNPTHSNSRSDVNYLLSYFPDLLINPKTCPKICRDLKIVECDEYDQIKKSNRTNEAQQADHLDCFRYMCNTWLKKWITRHQKLNR